MSAGTYNIKAEQGATFTRTLTWTDSNDAAIDITGYTARMQVRRRPSEPLILELTTENTFIDIPTGTDGVINLTVDAVTMGAITPNTYVYDLELINGATVTRLVQGSFDVSAEVSI